MVGEGLRPSRDFLLDTGVIIQHLRNDKRAHDLLDYLEEIGGISASAITYMEILIRCQPHEEEATMLFFDRVPPLVVSREVAQKAAVLIKRYPSVFGKGIQRGTPDALIAATAWQQQKILVTFNTRQFAKVPITEFAIQAIDQNARNWVATLKI